jgi:hypothetical protein
VALVEMVIATLVRLVRQIRVQAVAAVEAALLLVAPVVQALWLYGMRITEQLPQRAALLVPAVLIKYIASLLQQRLV